MTFKKARAESIELANHSPYWVFLYQYKSKEWFASDCKNFNSNNWYYVYKDGRILHFTLYDKFAKHHNSTFPFCKEIPKEYYGSIETK